MRNFSALKNVETQREYHITLLKILYPAYWDEGVNFYQSKGSKWKRKRWKKEITHYEYRMYRTWKYNRKTRWK